MYSRRRSILPLTREQRESGNANVHVFSNIFATRVNLKCGHKRFLEGPIPDISAFSHVNAALSNTWRDLENQGAHHGKIVDFLLVEVTSVSSNIQT